MGRFSIRSRIGSFKHAFNGLRLLFKEEHNSRIHFAAAITSIIAGFYFKIDNVEWLVLIITIALVIICEIINTAIEHIADFVSPDIHPKIKTIKDLVAGAVLISAISAVVVGLLIFFPKITAIL